MRGRRTMDKMHELWWECEGSRDREMEEHKAASKQVMFIQEVNRLHRLPCSRMSCRHFIVSRHNRNIYKASL